MLGRSDPTSNAEIVRNARAPFGFGRRPAIGVVAASLRCPRIAVVASPCRWPGDAPNDGVVISGAGH